MTKSKFLLLSSFLFLTQLVACSSTKTASYHYTQKQIERGDLSFANRLRVDEYVNAFPQEEFAKPKAGRDLEVRVDFITDVLPPTKTTALAQVAVRTREASAAEKSRAQGFVFVLDVSGSMSEDNKFLDAIEATISMLSELADGTEFALVTFSTDAKLSIEPVVVTKENREDLKAKIRKLEISGGTNIEAGLVLGYKTLASLKLAKTSRLLLLTDGNSNVGVTAPKELAKKAGVQYLEGARISTVGLGHDVDETLLRTIAASGQGAYYFAEDARSLKTLFLKEAASLMIPIAKKVVVTISSADATINQVYGYPKAATPREIVLDVGELNADDWRIFIVELSLEEKKNSSRVQARVGFETLGNGKSLVLEVSRKLDRTSKKKPKLDRVVARNAVVVSNALTLLKISELDKESRHTEAVDVVDIQLANMEIARDWDRSAEFSREFQNLERVKRILQEKAGTKHATAPALPPNGEINYRKFAIKGALALIEKTVAGPWGLVLGILTFAIDP